MAQNQPRAYDVVLGNQTPTPVGAAVLGGIAGVKRRFASADIVQRLAALQETTKYGQAGLELLFSALMDKSWQVRQTAYLLVQDCEKETLQRVLQEHNPYQLFECLYKYYTPNSTTYALTVSPDGQNIVSGGKDKIITVRSLYTGRIVRTLSGHTDGIKSIAISSSGQTLISCCWDNTVKVWQLQNAANNGGNLAQSKSLDKALLYTLFPHTEAVNCVAITPNGKTLATASEDRTIKLWDLPTQRLISTFAGHTGAVKSIAISHDGKILASGSADSTIKLWNLETGELLHTLIGHSDGVKCVAIGPDSKILISGSLDKTIKLWNLQTGRFLRTLIGHWDEVNHIAIARDGYTFASCSRDGTIRLWHLRTGTQLHMLEGYLNEVVAVAITPDGGKIVSSSNDRTIRVWGVR